MTKLFIVEFSKDYVWNSKVKSVGENSLYHSQVCGNCHGRGWLYE